MRILKVIQNATLTLEREALFSRPMEFDLTINPSGYLELVRELQSLARWNPHGPQSVEDVGWISTDSGTVYINIAPTMPDGEGIVEARIKE